MNIENFTQFSDLILEKSVLSAMTRDGMKARQYLSKLSDLDFTGEKNKKYFAAIKSLVESGKDVDKVSVLVLLKTKGFSRAEVWDISDMISSSKHLKTHFEQLKKLTTKRMTVHLCHTTANQLIDGYKDVSSCLTNLSDGLSDLLKNNVSEERSNEEIAQDVRNRVALIQIGALKLTGLFGIKTLDNLISVEGGELVVIAGASNIGKSWIANTIACHLSEVYEWPVKIFSMEMNDQMVARRMYSYYSGLDAADIRKGKVDLNSEKFLKAERTFQNSLVSIHDKGGLTISEIENQIFQSHYEHGLKAAIIDHGLLMDFGNSNHNDSRKIGLMANRLKSLAKNLRIPIILLWQLTKAVDESPGGKPKRRFMRNSGEVYEAADIVLMPWRPELYGVQEINGASTKGVAVIIVEKNRMDGNVGAEPLVRFDPSKGGYFPYDPIYKNVWHSTQ